MMGKNKLALITLQMRVARRHCCADTYLAEQKDTDARAEPALCEAHYSSSKMSWS
jgi:hypothetical protein